MSEYLYEGVTFKVYRVEDYRNSTTNPHEFFCEVDDERIISATELERSGIDFDDIPNWTTALKMFGEFYIDFNRNYDKALKRTVDMYTQ